MNTITESYPFCYAMKNGDDIDLYILVKVPTGKMITFPGQGKLRGQTKKFEIELASAGSNPDMAGNQYEHYNFPIIEDKETINTIEVFTKPGVNGAEILKTMKIAVSNLDIVSANLPLPAPPNGKIALDTPYVCTKLIEVVQNGQNVITGFEAEIYIISPSPKQFSVTHVAAGDADQNTISTIVGTGATGDTDFSAKNYFAIANVHTTDGNHVAAYNGNNGRKGKTKNKHHNKTPFPKLKRNPML
jgi:hypothetical protein